MKLLGNIFWFIFAGLWLGLGWSIAGLFWCITIIGIPWGRQCFKFAALMFAPFGKEVEYGGGVMSLLCNVIWICLSGIPLCIEAALVGCILCITIIGIPFGKQCFKYAKLALMPFGAKIVEDKILPRGERPAVFRIWRKRGACDRILSGK